MKPTKSIFETLFEINVNDHIEKKKDLTLSFVAVRLGGGKKEISKRNI